MIIIFFTITFFIGLSIFFFYRSEGIKHKLNSVQKEIKTTNKNNQNLIDSLAIIASKNEEFVLARLQYLKENDPHSIERITLLSPLVKNYALIVRELLKNKAQLKTIVKKCYDGVDNNLYNLFASYVNKQDIKIKRMWSGNNITSYMSLVEALITLNESIATDNVINRELTNKKAG